MIPNIFLKDLPENTLHCLFPNIWNKAVVIPLLKPNKNKHDKEIYRPIALTSCLCKQLEKIINKRLRCYLEKNNIICQAQSDFRENCSTDCLVTLE